MQRDCMISLGTENGLIHILFGGTIPLLRKQKKKLFTCIRFSVLSRIKSVFINILGIVNILTIKFAEVVKFNINNIMSKSPIHHTPLSCVRRGDTGA